MKISKESFILARARNIGHDLANAEFERLSKSLSKSRNEKAKIYLDEYGNEVHVRGPLVDRIRKTETLAERIARYDRLAAAVSASRASMQFALGEMFTNDPEEDPNDDSLLDNTEVRDEFGEVISPAAEPKMPAGKPAEPLMPVAGVSADEAVPAGSLEPSGMPSNTPEASDGAHTS